VVAGAQPDPTGAGLSRVPGGLPPVVAGLGGALVAPAPGGPAQPVAGQACPPEELVQLDYGEVSDLAQADREGRFARGAGPDADHSLHSCLWCLRPIVEVNPRPGAAALPAVVSVIGLVVIGVAIITAAEHSAGERTRAELGRLRKDRQRRSSASRAGPSGRPGRRHGLVVMGGGCAVVRVAGPSPLRQGCQDWEGWQGR
jgi:hypothetical protein